MNPAQKFKDKDLKLKKHQNCIRVHKLKPNCQCDTSHIIKVKIKIPPQIIPINELNTINK